MAKPGHTGITRIVKATGYSLKGFREAWKHESAFRQETFMLVTFVPLAIWLGQDAVQVSLLIVTLLLVVIVELLNSGIEAAIDRISAEQHKLSGRAKDMGSAAVLLSLLVALIVWSAVALERFVPGFQLH